MNHLSTKQFWPGEIHSTHLAVIIFPKIQFHYNSVCIVWATMSSQVLHIFTVKIKKKKLERYGFHHDIGTVQVLLMIRALLSEHD